MQEILKAASQTGAASIFAAVFGIITVKILALVLGPEGVGTYSVLNQVLTTALSLATLSGSIALVQGIASRKGRQREEFLGTVAWLFAAGLVIVGMLLVGLAPLVTRLLTKSTEDQIVSLVRWMALPVAFGVMQRYLTSTLNGFRAIGRLSIANVLSAATLALLAYPLARIVLHGQVTAFVWLIASGLVVQAMFGAWVVYREGWFDGVARSLLRLFRRDAARHFLSMAGVYFLTVQISSNVMLVIAALIARQGGIAAVGLFNTAWGLSMRYVMLILGSFGAYYMPTLSRIRDAQERTLMVTNVLRLTILVTVPLITAVIALKPVIVSALYSSEFLDSLKLLRWMLIGDYLKCTAYVFATVVIAYANVKAMFASEAGWYGGLLALSAISVQVLGDIQGIGIAFCLLYVVYILFYLFYVQNRYDYTVSRRDIGMWLAGLVLIIVASAFFWSDTHVRWPWAAIWITAGIGFSALMLTTQERSRLWSMVRTSKGNRS